MPCGKTNHACSPLGDQVPQGFSWETDSVERTSRAGKPTTLVPRSETRSHRAFRGRPTPSSEHAVREKKPTTLVPRSESRSHRAFGGRPTTASEHAVREKTNHTCSPLGEQVPQGFSWETDSVARTSHFGNRAAPHLFPAQRSGFTAQLIAAQLQLTNTPHTFQSLTDLRLYPIILVP